jgi:hypothetical protein
MSAHPAVILAGAGHCSRHALPALALAPHHPPRLEVAQPFGDPRLAGQGVELSLPSSCGDGVLAAQLPAF